MLRDAIIGRAVPGLRRLTLSGMRLLPPPVQARWLTALFLIYEAAILGVVYDFAWEAAEDNTSWRALAPRRWRAKAAMLGYCWRAFRDGLVIEGVVRLVRTRDGKPVDAATLRTRPRVSAASGGISIFPAWALEEMRALAAIEPQLAPTPERLAQYYIYSPTADPAPGEAYARLWPQAAASHAGAVVLCPWLKRGGADKGTLQFLEHYRRRFGRVLCIATYDAPSPWAGRVPDGVTFLEAGADLARLEPGDRRVVLTRLLLQLKPRLLHVINSDLGWQVLETHGRALRSLGVVLFASLFCDEIDASGRAAGYALRYAAACRPVLDRVLCDNAAFCRTLMQRDGFAPGSALPVYFWQEEIAPKISAPAAQTGEFLWAGRICPQKRPELLVQIAKAAPDLRFDVWGDTDPLSRRAARALRRLDNVHLHGGFDSFAAVAARARYAGYLYTSAFDGMPNVLLEAASAGLPLIAPAGVGGIGDLVSDATGFPVRAAGDPAAYVESMRAILAAPALAAERATAARAILDARHSRTAFDRSMQAVLDGVLATVAAV